MGQVQNLIKVWEDRAKGGGQTGNKTTAEPAKKKKDDSLIDPLTDPLTAPSSKTAEPANTSSDDVPTDQEVDLMKSSGMNLSETRAAMSAKSKVTEELNQRAQDQAKLAEIAKLEKGTFTASEKDLIASGNVTAEEVVAARPSGKTETPKRDAKGDAKH